MKIIATLALFLLLIPSLALAGSFKYTKTIYPGRNITIVGPMKTIVSLFDGDGNIIASVSASEVKAGKKLRIKTNKSLPVGKYRIETYDGVNQSCWGTPNCPTIKTNLVVIGTVTVKEKK